MLENADVGVFSGEGYTATPPQFFGLDRVETKNVARFESGVLKGFHGFWIASNAINFLKSSTAQELRM